MELGVTVSSLLIWLQPTTPPRALLVSHDVKNCERRCGGTHSTFLICLLTVGIEPHVPVQPCDSELRVQR